jgi:hypothetical protein
MHLAGNRFGAASFDSPAVFAVRREQRDWLRHLRSGMLLGTFWKLRTIYNLELRMSFFSAVRHFEGCASGCCHWVLSRIVSITGRVISFWRPSRGYGSGCCLFCFLEW